MFHRWTQFCVKVEEGTIVLSEVDKVLKKFEDDNEDENLRKELQTISSTQDTSWVDERIKQFKQYQAMSQHQDAARILLEVRDVYHLRGSFKPLENILKAVSCCVDSLIYSFIYFYWTMVSMVQISTGYILRKQIH